MGKKSTVLMILTATVLALGLTVYGEQLGSNNLNQKSVVEINTLNNYKDIEEKLRD